MIKTYIISSIDEIALVAKDFLKDFPGNHTFLFYGEMGVGKTTFINSLCRELGITESSSPTFSIVNEYESSSGEEVLHFDLYRLTSLREALDIGFEDYLDRRCKIFIEWPENAIELIAPPYVEVRLQIEKGHRKIEALMIEK